MVSMSLVLGSTMAVVGGPEAPEDGAAITSGSSSVTTSVNEDGTEWRSQLNSFGSSCLVGDQELGLNVTEVYTEGNMTISEFSGTLKTDNPCVSLESNVEEIGEKKYRMELEHVTQNGTCMQCIGSQNVNGSFSDDGDYTLEIVYRNETLEEIDTRDYRENKGLWSFVLSLFGF